MAWVQAAIGVASAIFGGSRRRRERQRAAQEQQAAAAAAAQVQQAAARELTEQEKYLNELLRDAEFQRALGKEAFDFFKQEHLNEQVRLGRLDARQAEIDARSDEAFDYAKNRQRFLDQREDVEFGQARGRQAGIDELAGDVRARQRQAYEAGIRSAEDIDQLAAFQTGELLEGYDEGRDRADVFSEEIQAQRRDLQARAAQGDAQAAADLATLDQRYRPLEDRVVDEAMAAGGAEAQERAAGRIGADIEARIGQQRAAGIRELQRRGMGGQVEDMLGATQDQAAAVGGLQAQAMNEARLAEEERGFARRAGLLGRGDVLADRAWRAGDVADAARARELAGLGVEDEFQQQALERVHGLTAPGMRAAGFRQAMQAAADDELGTALSAADAGLAVGDRAARGLDRATAIAGMADDGLDNLLRTQDARARARALMGTAFGARQEGTQIASGLVGDVADAYGQRAAGYRSHEADLYSRQRAADAERRERRRGQTGAFGALAGAGLGAWLAPAGQGLAGAQLGASLGGLAGGIFSARDMKEVGPEVEGGDALAVIEATPVHKYTWKPGMGPPGPQAGVMADDLAVAGGPSDGVMLNNASMHGMNQAAIKALSKRLKKVEGVLREVDSPRQKTGANVPDELKMYPVVMFS